MQHSKKKKLTCRSCGQNRLQSILSLGQMPVAEQYLNKDQLTEPEKKYPLSLCFCFDCFLVQLEEIIPPKMLYNENYVYFTSSSKTLSKHFEELAQGLVKLKNLDSASLVLEAGSNDGTMLKVFLESGNQVLGIDPAEKPARFAQKKGIPTICDFFTHKLAHRLSSQGNQADIFISNYILNIIADLNDFVAGIKVILKEKGTAVLEVPYFIDLIDTCAFDYIYHQNVSYFIFHSIDSLFRRHQLFINEVYDVSPYGGSLRIFVNHYENTGETVHKLIEKEKLREVNFLEVYKKLTNCVQEIKKTTVELLRDIKRQGKKIAVYGAGGGMTNTFLNYLGINKEIIDFAVDYNKLIQGHYMPGNGIGIFSPDKLIEEMPDYVLITVWNYWQEIVQQQAEYFKRGGKFIVPLPEPKIIEFN